MNTIDEAMIAILQKRLELSKLSYSDETYDDVEEVLHDLEDDFNEKYGDQLEEILEKVHIKHCPESDVLLPTAYLAKKFVETAKGTNLFFAIYADEQGKRKYLSIPLNDVIQRRKKGEDIAPPLDENGNRLLFTLSPNDLVYIPSEEEQQGKTIDPTQFSATQIKRVYKFVSCSGSQAFFIQNNVATMIADKVEFTASNKAEKSIEGDMIKSVCRKLKVNRLGKILEII